jgi:hypothetical protein
MAQIEAAIQAGSPGFRIPIASEAGVIWDLEGPGSTDILVDEDTSKILLTRCWLDDSEDEREAILALGSAPASLSSPFAEFDIVSGFLGILWPAESGDCIRKKNASDYALSTSLRFW